MVSVSAILATWGKVVTVYRCNNQCNGHLFSVVSASAILATWAKAVTASVTVTGPARTPIRACVMRPGGGQSVRSGVAQVKVATAADTETATARCKLVGVTLVSWSVYFLVYIVFFFGFVFAAFGTPFRLLCVFLCLFLQLQQINDDSISGKEYEGV